MSRARSTRRRSLDAGRSAAAPVKAAPVGRARDANPDALQIIAFNCAPLADADLPQALGVTYWFDAAPDGDPYQMTIRFVGYRAGARRGAPRSSFSAEESVRVVPGSGRVALTTRIVGLAPGEWLVIATPVAPAHRRTGRRAAPDRRDGLPSATTSGTTAYAPVVRVRAPGARLGAWPAFVSVGVLIGVSLQLLLAARAGLSVTAVLPVSLAGNLVGLIGTKLYYVVLHREPLHKLPTTGMGIQGYVLGAIGTLAAGSAIAGIPLGSLLDVTAPGLLFAMAIGRFGCFFGGCCAGRPTRSRWGLWSSDRRVGMRRIPTQLMESALASAIGAAALLSVLLTITTHPGVVFAGAIAAYTFVRQLLLPLRDLPRKTTRGRTLVLATTGFIVAADITAAIVF